MIKAMLLYRVLDPKHIELLGDWEALASCLAEMPARQPTGSQWMTSGFDKPVASISDELVWSGNDDTNMFAAYFHERQLPGTTIRDHLDERVRKVEEREQRKCYRKEIAQMKDDVVAMLLPKAFIKHTAVTMIVHEDLLIVGTSSIKRAEDCLTLLRKAIGSLSVVPYNTKLAPEIWLTDLMRTMNSCNLQVLDCAKLVNSTKDSVAFKGVDLSAEEPQIYLGDGFNVQELTLARGDQMYFKVTSQLIFKGIKFSDGVMDQVSNDANGDPGALIDGNLILLMDQIRRLLDSLQDLVGEERAEFKPSKQKADLIAEAATLIDTNGRASVALLTRNLGCNMQRAELILQELAELGQIEFKDGEFVINTNNYESPDNVAAQDAVDSKQEVDDFGDPIKPADDEDDDL